MPIVRLREFYLVAIRTVFIDGVLNVFLFSFSVSLSNCAASGACLLIGFCLRLPRSAKVIVFHTLSVLLGFDVRTHRDGSWSIVDPRRGERSLVVRRPVC